MPTNTLGAILLVDDYEDGREMYAEYLTFKGFRVVTAASGPAAVEIVRRELPALILMDIGMQGMTGTETLRFLREHHLCDGIPVVALTAFALESETTQALADGCQAVIPKPCLPDDLVTFITSILARQDAGSPR
jgi:two-component system cell cycle response regulator DivK